MTLSITGGAGTTDTYQIQGTTYDLATTIDAGLMSKHIRQSQLDGIAANANNYTLPTASTSTKGGVIIGNDLAMSGDTLNVTLSGSASNKFTEPIYIDNTNSTQIVGLCCDVSDGKPRLRLRMGGYDYIFNCDTSVTAGSG